MANAPATKKTLATKISTKIESITFWKQVTSVLLIALLITNTFTIQISLKPRLKSFLGFSESNYPITQSTSNPSTVNVDALASSVIPSTGVELPITWGDLGKRMVADGVIDEQQFRALFEGGLTADEEAMLSGNHDGPVILHPGNSRYVLNMLWAFGLANKNTILENGDMTNEQYGGAGNFASTGGWPLSRGQAMDHYSQHGYVTLTAEQQELVERVSKGIFRPCCGNSTYFPDCNHGMAMLGLLQLMAVSGVSETEMYQVALVVNSIWFPQTYLDLAVYFQEQGMDWDQVDPKLLLSAEFSSAQGYQNIREQINSLPQIPQGGGGCGA